ncbi:energy transducer TonB [Bacteroides sp. 51]|uniref:energy transducer TonB n=1 Tax=Bacteroides sp. 51 TaxID=2302938 RepID=UPI0013D84F7E|nr:energy transducer TonB [Bacteroides sp. 51]NDV80564.1 energy transducer TonB [Bacteroides sp. 51]
MKKVIYKGLYRLLSVITERINNRYINHYKIAVGTTLLLLSSGCQTKTKNQGSDENNLITEDSLYNEEDSDHHDMFCYVVEKMPEYPGGTEALMEFIRKNTYYPKECADSGIQGRVVVLFRISKDGSVSDPVVVRSVHPKLDEAALEVANKIPNFKPGTMAGEPARFSYTVPIMFKSEAE